MSLFLWLYFLAFSSLPSQAEVRFKPSVHIGLGVGGSVSEVSDEIEGYALAKSYLLTTNIEASQLQLAGFGLSLDLEGRSQLVFSPAFIPLNKHWGISPELLLGLSPNSPDFFGASFTYNFFP